MKKILWSVLILILVLCGVLFFNSFTSSSKQIPTQGVQTDISVIQDAEQRIAGAIQFQTVSYEDSAQANYEPFLKFHEYLKESFPEIFSKLEVETVNQYSLLIHWKGVRADLKPAILMAHMDVVPVLEDTKSLWTVEPFQGVIRDGYLWGRGAIDDKINLMSQLEAVEFLLKNNFKPQRDIYLSFGHDEEIGGKNGALRIAKLLHNRGVKAEFVLDEGGFVTNHMVPGVHQPVALVGTSEKGFLDLELSLDIAGGHSSMPSKNNAIQVMSQALTDLGNQPFSLAISPSVKDFMAQIAPFSTFVNKLALTNLWLFKPLVFKIYSSSAPGNAMIRTTMVPTIIRGGEKSNVVPNIVTAVINYRLLPGTSIQDVIEHTQNAINNPLIKIRPLSQQKEATGVSPIDNDAYRHISNAIHLNFGDSTIVTPFLMIGGTDSRNFDLITSNIYKFSPMIDPQGFHGVDERLNLKDYSKAIAFYTDLIKSL